MAGRPKVMAKRITELDEKLEELWGLLDDYMPKQYADRSAEGPLCDAWGAAENAITDASHRMGDLATMLRAKAGIPESERSVALSAEIAKMREQGESAQADACCEQGTSGNTEPMGAVDIIK
ncbi:MAG: hypothetical protein IID41_08105 [Planctomycetes bacterium]|nr:hypothetical protein [Planctomycetota bacterium]